MKLWSKEALVLGGIYGVLDTPFSLLGIEYVSDILFLLFIIFAVMLCFNKTPKFVSLAINQYSQTSYYLSAIGWIPYFVIIISVLVLGSYLLFGYNQVVLGYLLFRVFILALVAAILSLIVAYVKARKNKKDIR